MTEEAEEQPDPATIARPVLVQAGWRQDDSQSPFLLSAELAALKTKQQNHNEQK